jgi:hypothetical protein
VVETGVFFFGMGEATQALHKEHHGRHTGAGDLGGIMEGATGQAMELTARL